MDDRKPAKIKIMRIVKDKKIDNFETDVYFEKDL